MCRNGAGSDIGELLKWSSRVVCIGESEWGMRDGFAQFTAFSSDAADHKVFEQVKLTMPVLAAGGEKSFGALQAENHAPCGN